MQPDDHLCLCFHVTRRKVENFLRIERVQAPSQLSECGGAGTGCGWCRPFLRKLWEASRATTTDDTQADLPTADEYAGQRGDYVRSGGGTPPPGATPIE
ncbi:MAG: (2Fe-2S)-binding protein [Planctomycetota bacterium]